MDVKYALLFNKSLNSLLLSVFNINITETLETALVWVYNVYVNIIFLSCGSFYNIKYHYKRLKCNK